MPNSPAGWYVVPGDPGRLRWWTGESWSEHFAPVPPAPLPKQPRSGTGKRIAVGATTAFLGLVGLASSGVGGLLIMVGLAGMLIGVIAVVKNGVRSFSIRSRKAGLAALAASFAVVIVGGAVAPARAPLAIEASQVGATATAAPAASGPQEAAAEPEHEPVVVVREETSTSVIPFTRTTVEDPGLDAGLTVVTVTGVAGVRTITWSVTTTDGRETRRVKVAEEVTTPAIDEVTSIGTRVAPPPAAPVAPSCDPNYSGQCVPIASDVDCAGGSGNGPAYTPGPVMVVGSDVYDLDRDGDGIACD